ncbi:MAG: DUF1667 domain-containing protein [Lachnospiraceae bacterium]
MKHKKEMPCIVCPMSCQITVEYIEDHSQKEILSVTGNTCKRGEDYVRSEMTNPMRMLTSTVKLSHAIYKRLPVILSAQIPRGEMQKVMAALNQVTVTAPVHRNDIIIANVCGLAVDVIASRSIENTENAEGRLHTYER